MNYVVSIMMGAVILVGVAVVLFVFIDGWGKGDTR